MRKMPLVKIHKGQKYYLKITRNQSLQHHLLMITFLMLAFTGFPLKFYYYGWAGFIIDLFGGIHITRMLHRLAGVTMVSLFIYHLYYLLKKTFTLYVIPARKSRSFSWKELGLFIYCSPMFPRKKDLKDVFDQFKYVIFLAAEKPKNEKFHMKEKLDYWAVFWGIPILGLTGLVIWLPVWATSFLPGWAVNISYIAHSDEALLAVSVIFIWHMYNAHVNYDQFPMSPLFLTGYLPEYLIKREYYLEWERINQVVAMDPAQIVDVDSRKAVLELSDRQRLSMIREQIDFYKGNGNGHKSILPIPDEGPLNYTKYYHSLGLSFAKKGDYAAAFEAFLKAGGEPRAYNNIGCICVQKGEIQKAVLYFEKAIAANPTYYATACENLEKAKAALKRI
jgi:cytochrome b subunit of formate dehydrogenase